MGDVKQDTRSPLLVLRQWKELQQIKRQLVREGIIDGDATMAEVVEAMRAQVPFDLMGMDKPPAH